MEILELVLGLVEVCGCFLELSAVGSGVGTGVAAVKARKEQVARKAARQAGNEPPPASRWTTVFLLLLALTAFLAGMVAWKWSRPSP
jgi:hypothetical protein